MNKQDKYRQNQIKKGCCPHCGKPCTPYYECEERRTCKNFGHNLSHMVKIGLILRSGKLYKVNPDESTFPKRAMGYRTKEEDRRRWPRLGKKYFKDEDITNMMVEVLKIEQPLSQEEITNRVFQKITKFKTGQLPIQSNLEPSWAIGR